MTKADLVAEISRCTGIDKANVLDTVERMMEVVKDAVAAGDGVYLRGFGSFQPKRRAGKKARNIKSNITIDVPAHNIPFFKPAPVFKDAVRG